MIGQLSFCIPTYKATILIRKLKVPFRDTQIEVQGCPSCPSTPSISFWGVGHNSVAQN